MDGSERAGAVGRARAAAGSGKGAVRRRIISLSALFLSVIALVGLLPLWLALGLLVDLGNALRGRPLRLSAVRCALFLTLVALGEAWGVLVAFGLWLRRARLGPAAWEEAHYALQRRWAALLVDGTTRLYGMRARIEGAEALDGRPMLLLMRHVSVADGLFAVRYVNVEHGYRLRFVLKRELCWDPCLDIVGHRLPNAFVRRDGADSAREIARVRALADGLGPAEGVILFAEGTRFSPERRARALARLAEEGRAELLERARALRRTLPPRPGGVLGLMEQNPGLDVVICGHVGLEPATRLYDFVDGALVGAELVFRFWRFPAAEIPREPEARLGWLYERWAEMDAWVDGRLGAEADQATG